MANVMAQYCHNTNGIANIMVDAKLPVLFDLIINQITHEQAIVKGTATCVSVPVWLPKWRVTGHGGVVKIYPDYGIW